MSKASEFKNNEEVTGITFEFIEAFLSDSPFFVSLINNLKSGNTQIKFLRKAVQKQIEEEWVLAIEQSLVSFDNAVRKRMGHIVEVEEILPIELSHNITSRSLMHLSQHTDFISHFDEDNIIPTKILNVYNEETLLTYENRFLNTLIQRLYIFVSKRYDAMLKSGSENENELTVAAEFDDGIYHSSINFGITVTETSRANEGSGTLLERVSKLYSVAKMYYNSEFCKAMNGAYIRPPVMRTNALLKNKDLRQCLALWEFIAGYEKVGYSIKTEQTAEKPDPVLIDNLYASMALQYSIFCSEIKDGSGRGADEDISVLYPEFISEFDLYDVSSFNLVDTEYKKMFPVSYIDAKRVLSADEKKIAEEIDKAIKADYLLKKYREKQARLLEERRLEEMRLAKEERAAEEARRIEEEKRLERERILEEARRAAEEFRLKKMSDDSEEQKERAKRRNKKERIKHKRDIMNKRRELKDKNKKRST